MSREIILKKLEQMKKLIVELRELLHEPFSEFKKKFTTVRTVERNFQLMIDLASDINAHIIAEKEAETPDTYKDSFKRMTTLGLLNEKLLPKFIKSSGLRNVLVHEYDFDEDNFITYTSVKSFLVVYDEYIVSILKYVGAMDVGDLR